MKTFIWLCWIAITLTGMGYYGYQITQSEDKSKFLIGETSHGHYQIEMACDACHTEPFGGKEILQNACMNCHKDELEDAHDSHPKKKFTDPRNADRLEIIDARYCISCHMEHDKDNTHAMGVTLPDDYCWHCHQDVGTERPSHKDAAFDSCSSSGCHNYHDNKALYETFLVKNAKGLWLKTLAEIDLPNHAASQTEKNITQANSAFNDIKDQAKEAHLDHANSGHGQAGLTCESCHAQDNKNWIAKPALAQCESCHKDEAKGFKNSKHGMRLAQNLSPISTKNARLSFTKESADVQHGCNSCHTAHTFNTQTASTESCLDCHNDEHSLGFKKSPHGQLQKKSLQGLIPIEQSVSCATCHMPRNIHKTNKNISGTNIVNKQSTEKEFKISVEHNQNLNLRPNEKMIRPVCMQCHNLEFSIDALADKELIKNNFNGKPKRHIPSIDWALERDKQ